MEDKFLTPREVASLLQISYNCALQFVRQSGIPYIKIGRQYRVSDAVLKEYLRGPAPVEIALNEA